MRKAREKPLNVAKAPSRAKSVEQESVPQLTPKARTKSVEPESVPQFKPKAKAKSRAKSEDKEEVPVPATSRIRSRAKSIEPESIPQVKKKPRAKSRAKSEDKEEVPVPTSSRRRSRAKSVGQYPIIPQVVVPQPPTRGRRRNRGVPIAPIVTFDEKADYIAPLGGPEGGPMQRKSTSVPRPKRNRIARKASNPLTQQQIVEEIQKASKMTPGERALTPQTPLVTARGKAKAKGRKKKNGGLEPIMEFNEMADDPYVMRPPIQ
jgi:hypothetical protein